jgi:lipoate synthase
MQGKYCIKGCNFSPAEKHNLELIDINTAKAIKWLGLSYSVVISVTRCDL